MPSTITHAFIGLDTIPKLHRNPKNIILKHVNNYKVYCQSMDVLYFYHILFLRSNKIQTLGHYFHNRNVYNYFIDLIEDNRKNHDEELFTFIAGLITHYQADRIMHPYINYLANNKNKIKKINKHFEIETYLDNYFLSKHENIDYQTYKNYSFIFSDFNKSQVIEKEINKIFLKYFNFPKMGFYYYKSIKEMCFVYKHIRHDYYGIKKLLYQLIDFNPFNIRKTKYLSYHFKLKNDNYYLNSNHQKWYYIYNQEINSTRGVIELYDEIINNSSHIINELYKYIYENEQINIKELIGNYSYSTGKPLD